MSSVAFANPHTRSGTSPACAAALLVPTHHCEEAGQERFGQNGCRLGAGKQVTLGFVGPELGESFELTWRFDSFGDGVEAKRVGQTDDGPHDGGVAVFGAEAVYE